MKRRFYKQLYYQRNKNETILSVIKRMFGEHVTSRLVKMQNRELTFRGNCLQYAQNDCLYSMVSTEPLFLSIYIHKNTNEIGI